MPLKARKSNREVYRDFTHEVGAIVLGGGRGARLYPLTALRAKPAVPLLGRYRLIDIPLSQCIHSDIKRVVILTQFNSASLHRHITNSYHFDIFSKGFVEILAAEQTLDSGDWYQGTADAVRKQIRHIRSLNAKHYLVLSGDQLYRMDYRDLVGTHLDNQADITVAALPVAADAAPRLGILKVKDNARIAKFVEKPSQEEQLADLATPATWLARKGIDTPHRLLASMGVYVFRAEVLEHILATRLDWDDFGKHIIPGALKNHRVFAHLFNGFWEDIGTVRSYYEVHMQMAGPNPPLELFDPRDIIYTHPRYLPGSRLQDAHIKDAIICEGCRIAKSTIANSIVGIRSVVGSGSTIQRSVIMGMDFLAHEGNRQTPVPFGIGKNTTISGAIIDKNACIGDNVVIRGSRKLKDRDCDGYAIRDGIVVVFKNAVIPHGTHIE